MVMLNEGRDIDLELKHLPVVRRTLGIETDSIRAVNTIRTTSGGCVGYLMPSPNSHH